MVPKFEKPRRRPLYILKNGRVVDIAWTLYNEGARVYQFVLSLFVVKSSCRLNSTCKEWAPLLIRIHHSLTCSLLKCAMTAFFELNLKHYWLSPSFETSTTRFKQEPQFTSFRWTPVLLEMAYLYWQPEGTEGFRDIWWLPKKHFVHSMLCSVRHCIDCFI